MADKTIHDTGSVPNTQETGPQDPPTSAADGQRSEGPSGTDTAETAHGGADAVPGTPDALPYTPDETSED